MCGIERLQTADRHADPVDRNRIVLANSTKCGMRWTASAHIIFCVNLKEESVLLSLDMDRRQMFVLEAGAHQTGSVMRRKAADG